MHSAPAGRRMQNTATIPDFLVRALSSAQLTRGLSSKERADIALLRRALGQPERAAHLAGASLNRPCASLREFSAHPPE